MNKLNVKISKRGEEEKRKRDKITFRQKLFFISLVCLLFFSSSLPTAAQITVETSVISSGGGTVSGSAFMIESTIGQPGVGLLQNTPFTLFGGFVTPTFVPTAANVSVGGRVLTASGAGIRNVSVILNYPNGTMHTVSTGTFGAYRFEDVPVGEIYVVTVAGKKYSFVNSSQVISVSEQISDLNFTANEQ